MTKQQHIEELQDKLRAQIQQAEDTLWHLRKQLSRLNGIAADEPPAPELAEPVLTEPELADTPVVFMKNIDGWFWCEGCKENIDGYKQECVTIDGDKQLCLGCYTLQTLNKSGAFILPELTDERVEVLRYLSERKQPDASTRWDAEVMLTLAFEKDIFALKKIGYCDFDSDDHWQLTEAGRAALKAHQASAEGTQAS